MSSNKFLRQLFIVVLLSYLTVSINSASSSGSDNIQHASMFKTQQEENPKKELLELNDYPGTGPNPGHTPGPPPAGGK